MLVSVAVPVVVLINEMVVPVTARPIGNPTREPAADTGALGAKQNQAQ